MSAPNSGDRARASEDRWRAATYVFGARGMYRRYGPIAGALPAAVLLHQMDDGSGSWESLIRAARETGVNTWYLEMYVGGGNSVEVQTALRWPDTPLGVGGGRGGEHE